MMNKLDAKSSAGDLKDNPRLPHFVVLRLGDNVENLVDLGGLELTGTEERFRRSEVGIQLRHKERENEMDTNGFTRRTACAR